METLGKELKVKNISARHASSRGGYYTDSLADEIKKFIESGEYSNIVNMFVYGESNSSLTCTIVYEVKESKEALNG